MWQWMGCKTWNNVASTGWTTTVARRNMRVRKAYPHPPLKSAYPALTAVSRINVSPSFSFKLYLIDLKSDSIATHK